MRENFDFAGGGVTSESGNALESVIDPSGIGKKVDIYFDGYDQYVKNNPSISKQQFDSIPKIDVADSTIGGSFNRLKAFNAIKGLARKLFDSGAIKYLDKDERIIIYGTEGSDIINGALRLTEISGRECRSEIYI